MTVAQSDTLAIRVTLTKSDLFRSLLLTMMRQPYFWLTPVPLAFVIYTTILANSPYRLILALISVPLFLLLFPYLTSISIAKRPGVLAPITYLFTENYVSAQFVNGESKADWSLVTGAWETSNYIVVRMQRGSFHLVPKRLITTEQTCRLREILRAHVLKGVRLSN